MVKKPTNPVLRWEDSGGAMVVFAEDYDRLREELRNAATSLRAAADRLNDAGQFASGSIAHNAAFIAEDAL